MRCVGAMERRTNVVRQGWEAGCGHHLAQLLIGSRVADTITPTSISILDASGYRDSGSDPNGLLRDHFRSGTALSAHGKIHYPARITPVTLLRTGDPNIVDSSASVCQASLFRTGRPSLDGRAVNSAQTRSLIRRRTACVIGSRA
jgi:hypothetical protein